MAPKGNGPVFDTAMCIWSAVAVTACSTCLSALCCQLDPSVAAH